MILAKEIINKGAEAVILKHKNTILKYRLKKEYRHPVIDEKLRKFRTNREQKVIAKVNELNIPSAKLIVNNDDVNKFMLEKEINPKYSINMTLLDGFQLKQLVTKDNFIPYAEQIGAMIAKLHSNDIVHGDLTTSNMIVHKDMTHLIDFGLSNFSSKDEDKAVDLHLLKEALNSKHSEFSHDFFNEIIDVYRENYPDADAVLERFKIVEKRGRNKH